VCGIAGLYDLSNVGFDTVRHAFASMSSSIKHRGPDEHGRFEDSRTVFLHRRLSIVDLQSGQQPMEDETGQIVLIFNGEIFNYIELRKTLILEGCQFRTNSDTEVILHLYVKYGENFVQYLNGQFAVAIRDRLNDKLILARDRVGICPLFYSKCRNLFVFASEIKAIIPALGSSPSIFPEALDELFTFWAPASPNTIFKDIFEVRPGHILTIEQVKIKEQLYWDCDFPTW